MAGALPAALTAEFLSRGWLTHGPGRSLRTSDDYEHELDHWLTE